MRLVGIAGIGEVRALVARLLVRTRLRRSAAGGFGRQAPTSSGG